MNGELITN